MLTQEELDKLLQEEAGGEGGESADDSQDQEAKAEGESAAGSDDASGPVSQDELDKLLEGGDAGSGGSQEESASDDSADDIDWSDAFKEAAEGGDAAAQKAVSEGLPEDAQAAPEPSSQPSQAESAPSAQFNELTGESDVKPGTKPELNFLLEIPLEVQVELGRCTLQIKELLQLGQGSIVELNKMAGEPADIYVNRKLMAKGEVVVVNEKFGIKLTEIISPQERVKSLG